MQLLDVMPCFSCLTSCPICGLHTDNHDLNCASDFVIRRMPTAYSYPTVRDRHRESQCERGLQYCIV
jgi:hypothetical protein